MMKKRVPFGMGLQSKQFSPWWALTVVDMVTTDAMGRVKEGAILSNDGAPDGSRYKRSVKNTAKYPGSGPSRWR